MNDEMKRIKKQAEVVADVFQIIGGAIKAVSDTIQQWPNDNKPALETNNDKKEIEVKEDEK